MNFKMNLNLLLGLITVLAIVFMGYNMIKNNDLKNEIVELKREIVELENEQKDAEEFEETSESNTFDDDIKWFVEEVYGLTDRAQLFENISSSLTKEVTDQLFGEDQPPKKVEGNEEKSLERKVESVNIYGKFEDKRSYTSLVTFDLSFEYKGQADKEFTIVRVDLKRQKDGTWLISEIEEFPNK